VSAARQALAGFDSLLGASAFYDASLCVSELVTNAVLHADIGADAELRLDVAIDARGKLRVEVTDTGRGFTPPASSAGDDTGWGLFLVDRLSDDWGVDCEDGTRVWFEMRLADDHGEPSAEKAQRSAAGSAPPERHGGVRNRVVGRLRLGPQTTG
jgi:anti-sigma regulatory factor (Ser/Thr protein kinase)